MNQYDYIITKPPLDEDTLAHYGIKGMKWRHRKGRKIKNKSQRFTDSDYIYEYDPVTKTHRKILKIGPYAEKKKKGFDSVGVSQVTRSSGSSNSGSNKPISRTRNVTGKGTGGFKTTKDRSDSSLNKGESFIAKAEQLAKARTNEERQALAKSITGSKKNISQKEIESYKNGFNQKATDEFKKETKRRRRVGNKR